MDIPARFSSSMSKNEYWNVKEESPCSETLVYTVRFLLRFVNLTRQLSVIGGNKSV